jgi:hypothetical protein
MFFLKHFWAGFSFAFRISFFHGYTDVFVVFDLSSRPKPFNPKVPFGIGDPSVEPQMQFPALP